MAKIFRMPEISANATHAVLQSWVRQVGDAVSAGDAIAEIETDKALVEVNVDEDGTLARVLAKAGDEVPVGAPIAVVVGRGEADIDIDALLAGHRIDAGGTANGDADCAANDSIRIDAAATSATAHGRVFASPLARRLAAAQGIALETLRGSGPNGRIVKRDVDAAADAAGRQPAGSGGIVPARVPAAPPAAASTTLPDGVEAIPHTGMRRAIAQRLAHSKSTVPHFYLDASCRVDRLIALRAEINASGATKVSLNDFVVKAVAMALRQVPQMNVTWSDEALHRHAHADVAVAVSTDTGLLTPVIRHADDLTLSALSTRIAGLATRARAGRLLQTELEGGSFTVSNLGMYGTESFSAILNPPQSAILAVGAATPQPVVVDGALAVGTLMRCTLSVDHRAIDGALAAQWLKAFEQLVENPLSILV
ncbi:dihydrolipoamide acetyltransferase family protein [Burkholderia sp. JKS000303]|uniref:dihydrolipoamide acetyltransferase family protein n=1 Tax=Burkholderia sp. JKS000303 TaxID=1938747 RepID=UPI000BF86874|nr:dihydrolipoamide acetyltransferase family protein [Burkholderia sp. JKS000303]PFH20167.1 pyruvate dehydrogenase E2 component (dihydrolipoamide acetyltransferase) [Burkholderia sp. JKS000303]